VARVTGVGQPIGVGVHEMPWSGLSPDFVRREEMSVFIETKLWLPEELCLRLEEVALINRFCLQFLANVRQK